MADFQRPAHYLLNDTRLRSHPPKMDAGKADGTGGKVQEFQLSMCEGCYRSYVDAIGGVSGLFPSYKQQARPAQSPLPAFTSSCLLLLTCNG